MQKFKIVALPELFLGPYSESESISYCPCRNSIGMAGKSKKFKSLAFSYWAALEQPLESSGPAQVCRNNTVPMVGGKGQGVPPERRSPIGSAELPQRRVSREV